MKGTLNIVLQDGLQELLDHFTACFGIRIGYFAPDGRALQIGLKQPSCDFCKYIRNELGLTARCAKTDQERLKEAATRKKLLLYECHAGLMEAIQPVLLDGELLGFIMMGQFRRESSVFSETLLNETSKPANARRELMRHFNNTTLVPEEKLRHLLALFSLIVTTVSSQRLVQLQGSLLLHKIEQLIQERVKDKLTLADVARHVHRSASTVAHLCQDKLGSSFKQMAIKAKMQEAQRMLSCRQDMSVSEIATQLGYGSPFHFSRLFKKHLGISPRDWRNAQRPQDFCSQNT